MYGVITGASSEIGKEIAISLAESNYNLILTYFKNDISNFKEELINKYNVDVVLLKCDISKENDIKKLYELSKNKNIKVLVNASAINMDSEVIDKTKEDFMKVLEVNLVGTFLVSKYISNIMEKGIIINISSLDSTKTFNSYSIDYIASKAGVNTLVKTMSLYYKNIKFISLLLPFVKTKSVLEMNEELLKGEMSKYNQKELLDPKVVGEKVINIINDDKLSTGSIIEMEEF